jgi:hypothetical protein
VRQIEESGSELRRGGGLRERRRGRDHCVEQRQPERYAGGFENLRRDRCFFLRYIVLLP